MSRDTKIKDIKIMRSGFSENYEQESQNLAQIGTERCIPNNRDAICLYADEPCVEACQLLYDLNIETYTSGGHVDGKENAIGIAYVGVCYDTLSEQNKQILADLINRGIIEGVIDDSLRGNGLCFSISTPITSDSLVGEVSDKLASIASMFQQQDVLYGRMTYDELRNKEFPSCGGNLYRDNSTFERINKAEMDRRFSEYLEDGTIKYVTGDGTLYFRTIDLLNKHNDYIKSMRNKLN